MIQELYKIISSTSTAFSASIVIYKLLLTASPSAQKTKIPIALSNIGYVNKNMYIIVRHHFYAGEKETTYYFLQ